MPTEAQKRANKRLQSKKDRLAVWLDKDGTKERIIDHAAGLGLSLNQYVVGLIKKDMEKGKDTEKGAED